MNNIPRSQSPTGYQGTGPGEQAGASPGDKGAGGTQVLPEVGVSAVAWTLEPGSLLSRSLGAWLRHIFQPMSTLFHS